MRYPRGVRCRVHVIACAALVGVLSSPLSESPAAADGQPLAGAWSAGALTEIVNVGSWVDECGARPKARTLTGGSYQVTSSGDELVFTGAQSFRTDACFLQEETRRVSHSANPALRTWKTRCESAPGDPRRATITTVVRAQGDDVIVLTETARTTFTFSSGTCSADVERTRVFSIVARDGAPSASSATGATIPSSPPLCDALGEPSTLEVRPKRKLLRSGEQFDFKARILDEKGCEVPGKIAFRLAPESSALSSTILVETGGHVRARADAEPAEASLLIEAASKTARVSLEIVSDQRYEELVGTDGLDDRGVDDQSVSVVVSGGKGSGVPPSSSEPQGDDAARRRFAYVAIAGGTLTLLSLGGLVLWRRGAAAEATRRRRRIPPLGKPRRADLGPLRRAAPPPTPISLAAYERSRVHAGHGLGATMLGAPDAPTGAPVVESHIRVCPLCGERYPADAGFCPIDGQRLVAVRDAIGMHPVEPSPLPPGRICPVCGKRYAPDAGFCGVDGVELVPLN